MVALLASACGSGQSKDVANDTAPPLVITTDADSPKTEIPTSLDVLEDVTGELVITRQRDLLDRGLINVLTRNDSEHDLIVFDRALDVEFFQTDTVEGRSSIVGAGRQTAIQVPYGIADDCSSSAVVSAELVIEYSIDDASTRQRARVDLAGTEILDGIRAKQCASQAFREAVDWSFMDVKTVDGTLAATLVLERAQGNSSYLVTGAWGTILVGITIADGPVAVRLDDSTPTASLPVVFVVNRCDPHALAEVTKRYGLDLDVSIDDNPPQPISIDVTPLAERLEDIVESCRQQSEDS